MGRLELGRRAWNAALGVLFLFSGCAVSPDSDVGNPLAAYADSVVEGVYTNSLTGKVMVGYQGWFNAGGDGAGLDWTHWTRPKGDSFGPENVAVDLWPDMREYGQSQRYATEFRGIDGEAIEVFSSYDRETVLLHFQWMRDYGIDGAFVQRFANGLGRPELKHHKDVVLASAREGANRYGRAYAVMYDLSGLPTGGVESVRNDWIQLREQMRIMDDPAYLRHEGKPLVSVWGVGFSARGKLRAYTLDECMALVDFLKADGCSVMLGVPTQWREGGRDAMEDPRLQELLARVDVVSPWTVGRYRDLDTVERHAIRYWQPDQEWCVERSVDYLPVVFPGFSWHNQNGGKLDQIPRLKGTFFWSQIEAAKRIGAEMIYVAMFDEMDEGTAIFKCTNTPPFLDGSQFLGYEGLPSDYYLRLAGEAGRFIRNEHSTEIRYADY